MKKLVAFMAILSLILGGAQISSAAKPDHAGGKPDKGPSGPLVKSICIDPGHGGDEPGTSGQLADGTTLKESRLNLDVALSLAVKLQDAGYETHLTRINDNPGNSWSNNDRYTYCNGTNATSLISIHHNGSTDRNVDYPLALYHQGSSKSLASTVGQAVANEFHGGELVRVERFPSGVLIKSDMPSMMSEGYFLTNQARLNALSANYSYEVEREAAALTAGIHAYYAN